MRADPKVSIVMPVYNGGRYFELALESALAQTYGDVEIIVVNDGSRDGGETDEIARRYQDRITYIPQENRGVAGALNTAIRHMSGDVFTWLSHDDLYLPEKTATQVDYYRRMRQDAILFSDWKVIDAAGEIVKDIEYDHAALTRAPMLAMLIPCINGCTIFIPRQVLEATGPFEERYRYTQDYHLWNRILGEYDFFHVPRKLVLYREHPGQGSHESGAAVEGDELWIKIIGDRSETERVQTFGSSKRFYARMGTYFSHSPYKQASRYALDLARECLAETLVSVVLPAGPDDETRRTAMSILGQTHSALELLLVHDGSAEARDRLSGLAAWDDRVRLVRGEPDGSEFEAGLLVARGSYVAFARPGARFCPQKIARQLRAMQESGDVVSHTSWLSPDPEGGLRETRVSTLESAVGAKGPVERRLCIDTLMVHASLASEGISLPVARASATGPLRLSPRHVVLGIEEVLSVSAIESAAPEPG